MWRIIDLDITKLLISFVVFAVMAAAITSVILFVVGETVEHFTP